MRENVRIKNATREIVALLVTGDYAGLERRTEGIRLTADDMLRAVREYGRRLRMPPQEAFDSMSIVEIVDSAPRAWSVVCDLWTEEVGRSDLSLELTLIDEGDTMRVELDNLHPL